MSEASRNLRKYRDNLQMRNSSYWCRDMHKECNRGIFPQRALTIVLTAFICLLSSSLIPVDGMETSDLAVLEGRSDTYRAEPQANGIWSNEDNMTNSIYVSPKGNDSNPGTLEKPFATLEQARNTAQILKENGLPEDGVTIWLRGGIYEMQDSFMLTDQDSGTERAPIVYSAYDGENVQLVGWQELKAEWFTPVRDNDILERIISKAARKDVLQVDLKAHGITDYGELSRHGYVANEGKTPQMELFVNGERMILARWPNDSYVSMAEVVEPGSTRGDSDFWDRGGTFRYDFDRPEFWNQADDIWLDGSFGQVWEWTYKKVAKIDASSRTITFRDGEVTALRPKWGSGNFFYAENLLEEIDMPGEYYIDRKTGVMYLLPPESFKNEEPFISVSMLKKSMIHLQDVSYVAFRNLVFDTGRDIAVSVAGGESVSFERCEIRNFTRGGIQIDGHRHMVSGCHLHHIGGTVISLDGGDLETLEHGGNVVENCHIHDFAHWNKVYNPGVAIRGVAQHVTHCLIHDGTHMGIQVRGGNDHLIDYNEFYSVPKTFNDIAAIYMVLGGAPHHRGTVIRRNYFHHIGLSGKDKQAGVYPDNETMGIVIEENVFYKIGTPQGKSCWAVMNHGGAHIHTRNNIFVDCTNPFTISFRLNGYAKDRVPGYMRRWREIFDKYDFANMPHGKKYPELLNFFEEDRIIPTTNTFTNNLIYNPTNPREYEGIFKVVYSDADKLQAEGNRIVEGDPGFVDLENMDFTLDADAVVFREIPEFKPIPFREIGLSGPVGPLLK